MNKPTKESAEKNYFLMPEMAAFGLENHMLEKFLCCRLKYVQCLTFLLSSFFFSPFCFGANGLQPVTIWTPAGPDCPNGASSTYIDTDGNGAWDTVDLLYCDGTTGVKSLAVVGVGTLLGEYSAVIVSGSFSEIAPEVKIEIRDVFTNDHVATFEITSLGDHVLTFIGSTTPPVIVRETGEFPSDYFDNNAVYNPVVLHVYRNTEYTSDIARYITVNEFERRVDQLHKDEGVNYLAAMDSLSISPNPASSELRIRFSTDRTIPGVQIAIHDINANRVKTEFYSSSVPLGEHVVATDISTLTPGVYSISIMSGSVTVGEKLFVVSK